MKGFEGAEVMLEDEVLAPPNMRAVQLKQAKLCQQMLLRHGEDLCESFMRERAILTFSIQGRSQFRDRQIGCDQTGVGIGKEPIPLVGASLDVIAFDERAFLVKRISYATIQIHSFRPALHA